MTFSTLTVKERIKVLVDANITFQENENSNTVEIISIEVCLTLTDKCFVTFKVVIL